MNIEQVIKWIERVEARVIALENKPVIGLEALDQDIDLLTNRVQTLETARQEQRAFNQTIIEERKTKPSSGWSIKSLFIRK